MGAYAQLTFAHGISPLGTAVFSLDRKYRYELNRSWGESSSFVVFVMLNPSTANEMDNDATIRRCIGFAKRWGYEGITVVNLYAVICTDSKLLPSLENPVGINNDRYLQGVLEQAKKNHWPVVAAWGEIPIATSHRARDVVGMAKAIGVNFECLGTTKSGAPCHPVRLPYARERQLWSMAL